MTTQKIIYDLGANNGDDLGYYLEKAEKVVAVEALPQRAEEICQKFEIEISEGRLIVENVAVTDSVEAEGQIDIWIHEEDAKSTLMRPTSETNLYSRAEVRAVSIMRLIEEHGFPYFVKVDLENYDARILRALFLGNVFPTFISAEGHDPSVFGLLSGLGNYTSFKFVQGRRVEREFKDFAFRNLSGEERRFSFRWGSAGPFGDDIPGPWYEKYSAYDRLRLLGTGWLDIHASYEEGEEIPLHVSVDEFLRSDLIDFLEPPIRGRLRKLRRGIRALKRLSRVKLRDSI